ncbi:putative ABC-type amino acid transport/signal transduction systems, periplasmic component fused with GGDEF domain [Vibrio nigripulchritudo SFn27]|uniref:diguanylate cyclase n=2 Tax=Vibrio nigripulchritudo TaxID=28173 RepID=U4KIT8_9VIBR|nr:transporter substrate-binding domain-containing protein [Vibrio nigripulchritudo]CCN81947.1 putative ABC-type amino acid transport/signal transduction systems, periplasmic component fused with GGDEF domain [Vibrio nigripulchritudo BLFn1]CCN90410.1 putative ABC-type amino acid transport/signal transduction systems, periplasmic component fused with GGDEF domain [Vibrio nigripulchritudo SFn27]CCN93816.1 putative ABC-type amino acid transport/signal transduction systems, periplasmic component fus
MYKFIHLLRWIIPLVVTLFLVAKAQGEEALTAEEKLFLERHPVWKVHSEDYWPPFNYREFGERKGYSTELILLLAQQVGSKVKFVDVADWTEALEKLKAREIDIISNMTPTSEGKQFATFTDSKVFAVTNALLFSDSVTSVTSLSDLIGKTLAVVKGAAEIPVIRENYPDIRLIETQDTLHSIEKVISGGADAAMDSEQVLRFYLENYIDSPLRVFSLADNANLGTYFQTLAVRSDRPQLASILDKAYRSLSPETIQSLKRKWLTNNQANKVNVLNLNRDDRNYLNKKQRVRYCIHPDFLPVEGVLDGKPQGMTGEYVQFFEKSLNIKFEHVPTSSWEESLKAVDSGACDILSLSRPVKSRLNYLVYTQPYLSLPVAVAIHQNTPYAAEISALAGRYIGFNRNHGLADEFQARYPDINFVPVDSAYTGLQMVENKELFGFIGALPVVTYHLQHYFPNLMVGSRMNQAFPLSVGVSRDEAQLAEILNKAIENMDIRLHSSILNSWTPVNYKPVSDNRLVWAVLVIGCIVVGAMGYSYYVLQVKYRKLEELSTKDRLTGLYNRYTIDTVLAEQVAQFGFSRKPFSVILGDIDHFKILNDHYGHLIGDQALITMSRLFESHISGSDLVGRWGGEELIVICPGQTEEQASYLAETLRRAVNSEQFEEVGSMSCSFGVAQYFPKHTLTDLMQRADRALYQSKRMGRNTVTSYTDFHLEHKGKGHDI